MFQSMLSNSGHVGAMVLCRGGLRVKRHRHDGHGRRGTGISTMATVAPPYPAMAVNFDFFYSVSTFLLQFKFFLI